MADTAVPITAGTGTNIDTRTEGTNGNHRQVVVLGDPATNAGVAPVDATAGLKVDLGADNDVTVTGTVDLGATDNAVLDAIAASAAAIDTDATTIIGHVDGIETLLGTIDADTSNLSTKIDTIAGDTTSIQTAVELLDDTVATDGSATPTKGILIAGQDGTNAQTIKTDSDGNLQVDILTIPTTAVTNAGITTIAGAVSGTEMQVDVITMPTTTVQATNLDIRDLAAASDAVTVHGDVGAIDQLDLTNSNPAAVAIVDGNGDQITSFGGGTQYTEADTDASITGTAIMFESNTGTNAISVVSNSTPLPISDAGGAITVDGTVAVTNAALTELAAAINSDKVDVNIVSGSAAGTEYTEDAAAAANPAGGALILVREDARAGGLTNTDGDNVAARGNNKGELYVKSTDSDALLTTIDGDTGNISTKIDTIAGAVSGSEMQVDIVSSALPTGASTLAEQQSQTTHLATIAGDTTDIETAVELIDDTVATLGTTTYTEAATKGLIIGAVRRDADTTLVDTTNEVTPLQVDAAGRLKVEAFSGETLPVSLTSTTVTGTVAVTQSGTWDEVGINDSGNSITVDYATTGSGTATGALRVELPTNGTGVIATVGAVTAITNALPAGTNAIGKLAANSGVDIGDVDITSIIPGTGATNLGKAIDSATGATDTGVLALATRDDALSALTPAEGDNVQLRTDSLGNLWVSLGTKLDSANDSVSVKGLPSNIDINGSNADHADKYYTSTGAATDGIVWSPAAGKRWHVLTLYINVSAAATVTLEDDLAGGDVVRWKGELAANSGVVLTYDRDHPFCSGEDAADLIITTSAGNVYVQAVGYEV